MKPKQSSRAIRLPFLELTEVVDSQSAMTSKIEIESGDEKITYFTAHCFNEKEQQRVDGKPIWMGTRFNLFPVVVDSHGAPWPEANLYLLARLEEAIEPNMESYKCIADDLSAFFRFVEEMGIAWQEFPKNKLYRPTYRFRAQLMADIASGRIAATTGKRRIGGVVGFYRWMITDEIIFPENKPWEESDVYVELKGSRGLPGAKKIKTTDLRIVAPKTNDPFDEYIEDGGRLRPLPADEQEKVLEVLASYGNTELTLMHLIALFTGARVQTVLTFKVSTITKAHRGRGALEVRIPVGLGTGVDTKNGKRQVLHMPIWLWERLCIYSKSNRATSRRRRAPAGDVDEQYFFLTAKGAPFYERKIDLSVFDGAKRNRHSKTGQAVRQLITEFVIPHCLLEVKGKFSYSFHDLRATFGMNLTDHMMKCVQNGEISLHEAREFVRVRMGHESSLTTDLYLKYRGRIKFYRAVNDAYGEHLRDLVLELVEGKYEQ